MRTARFLFGILLVLVDLTGCGRKETIAGQLFIATAGGDNIKLGAAHVLLIENAAATNALQRSLEIAFQVEKERLRSEKAKYEANVEAANADVRNFEMEVTNQEQNVDVARQQFNKTSEEYNDYIVSQPLRTNVVYVKIYRDLIAQRDSIQGQQEAIAQLQQEEGKSSQPGETRVVTDPRMGWSYAAQNDEAGRIGLNTATQVYLANAERQLSETYAQINQDKQALEEMLRTATSVQQAKLNAAETSLNNSERRLSASLSSLASTKLRAQKIEGHPPIAHTPTLSELFERFAPPVAVSTETDANGTFSLTYSRHKKYTLFVHAERATPLGVEQYFWLVDAPSASAAASVLLDNNDMVNMDPDGYLSDSKFTTIRLGQSLR